MLPRWGTLDPIKEFVTAAVVEGNGWMADSHEGAKLDVHHHADIDRIDFSVLSFPILINTNGRTGCCTFACILC